MILDVIAGYAAVFDKWSLPINDGDRRGDFEELTKPGAFDLLCSGKVYADIMHADHNRFAGTGDGSLRLWQDAHGLAFEIDIPATAAGAGISDMLARYPMQASFGIVDPVCEWVAADRRVVRRCLVDHVTIAAEGAYPTASWLASMPLDRMPPATASAARRWRIGALARDQAIRQGRAAPARPPRGRGGPIPPAIMAMIQAHAGRQGRAWGRGF